MIITIFCDKTHTGHRKFETMAYLLVPFGFIYGFQYLLNNSQIKLSVITLFLNLEMSVDKWQFFL